LYNLEGDVLIESHSCFGFSPMYLIAGLDYIFIYRVYHYPHGQSSEFIRFELSVFKDREFVDSIIDYLRNYR